MPAITFKFEIDQRVTTPFGDVGVVDVQAVDAGGITYYVKTAAGGNWLKEAQIAAA